MQYLFLAADPPQSYADGSGKYPDAPSRCPHCHIPAMMKKHGFYKRYIILISYDGVIRIRRYICDECQRTVSMLPSFCVPRYQYGTEIIITALLTAIIKNSVTYAATKWPERPQTLTRRHIIQYRKRIMRNRGFIQLGLNLMSPEFISLGKTAGDTEWTRKFLEAVAQIKPPQFNSLYHGLTRKSFMSLRNNVA